MLLKNTVTAADIKQYEEVSLCLDSCQRNKHAIRRELLKMRRIVMQMFRDNSVKIQDRLMVYRISKWNDYRKLCPLE
jgi:hypothetical protein